MLASVARASLEEIALDASVRALDHQERAVMELRSRTGLLLAASSLAISFLGPAASDGRPAFVACALLAFALSLGATAWILVPRPSFTFSITGSTILEEFYDYRDAPAELHRQLAYELADSWTGNDRAIRRLIVVVQIAAGSLGVEIVFLVLAGADTLL